MKRTSLPLRRRSFITLLGGAAAAWPVVARGQQSTMPVIGFLNGASAWEYAHVVTAFRQGLSEAGYDEGRNVFVEYRWAEGHYDRLPTLAAALIQRRVALIVGNTPSALAAKNATTTIPIIFYTAADPVKQGLVASLNRPGGNATGITNLSVEVGPKQLQLLHEIVPMIETVAVLVNPTNPDIAEAAMNGARTAALSLHLRIHVLNASSERELEETFNSLKQREVGGLLVSPDPFFNSRHNQIIALASRYAVPTIYQLREFAVAGGLCSYGASIAEASRQAGLYAGKVLNGAKPSDLPVQQATKFELIINLKTAKALGITVPPMLLARADEVIE